MASAESEAAENPSVPARAKGQRFGAGLSGDRGQIVIRGRYPGTLDAALTGVMTLTERLYYTDSFLTEFEARVVAVSRKAGEMAVTLNRSAFYPTSGGQVFDTGCLQFPGTSDIQRIRVKGVAENEQTGNVLHIIEGNAQGLQPGALVRGTIDADRRRDHMQQHSGQHVLSAAFEQLYGFLTVSFQMGDER